MAARKKKLQPASKMISFRLKTSEYERLVAAIQSVEQQAGITVSPSNYVRAAVMERVAADEARY